MPPTPPGAMLDVVMPGLLLTPAADAEGQLSNFDFDAMADGTAVGRITLDLSGLMWFWIIDASLRGDRDPAEGREASREVAVRAFATAWHREEPDV
jgi:hypothetical protein